MPTCLSYWKKNNSAKNDFSQKHKRSVNKFLEKAFHLSNKQIGF